MATTDTLARDEVTTAHELIGGFIVRCSLLEYRASQLVARWFCAGQKQKYLSYVLHGMSFRQSRQIIEERLTAYHPDPQALRGIMAEIQPLIERRDLVASGLLAKRRDGAGFCVKSHSGLRFLTAAGEEDIVDVGSLAKWSQKATNIADRLVRLGEQLRESAS